MTWSIAQQGGNSGTSSVSLSFSAPSYGNLWLVSVFNSNGSGAPTSVQDSAGNNFTLINHNIQSINAWIGQYIVPIGAGFTGTLTATLASQVLYMTGYELHNSLGPLLGQVDGTPVNGNSGTTTATSTSAYAPTMVTTVATDLVVTTLGFRAGSPTSGSLVINTGSGGGQSFTIEQSPLGAGAIRLADAMAFETATGSYNPNWSWTTSRNTLQLTTALKPPAAQVGNTGGMFQCLPGT